MSVNFTFVKLGILNDLITNTRLLIHFYTVPFVEMQLCNKIQSDIEGCADTLTYDRTPQKVTIEPIPPHTLIKMTAGSDALGFREECLLLQLKCDLLETPEIAKILCNVYKGLCIAKYPLKQLFTVDLPCKF
jgi:hypothetical protein